MSHCTFCRKPTLGDRCSRCGRDLCVLHLPEAKNRCETCEDEYHNRRTKVRYWLIGGLASLPALTFWTTEIMRHCADPRYGMAGKTMGLPDLLVGIVSTVAISCGFVIALRMWLLRRRFLAERLGGHAAQPVEREVIVPPGAEVLIASRDPDVDAEKGRS